VSVGESAGEPATNRDRIASSIGTVASTSEIVVMPSASKR